MTVKVRTAGGDWRIIDRRPANAGMVQGYSDGFDRDADEGR